MAAGWKAGKHASLRWTIIESCVRLISELSGLSSGRVAMVIPPAWFQPTVKIIYAITICAQLNQAMNSSATGVLKTSVWSGRSEEHTSELQSRFDLVCRLLLEKKK